ncbi:MAG: alkaline phosphatase family protein [Myxococcales bacterium]|jgi:predicted AlkP superfamily pyrophosphatase or phosphodiesterase
MHRTLVIDVVGLTPDLVGEHTPNLSAFARQGALRPMSSITPAVTCAAQSTLVTGSLPRDHGIVANGWYFRDLCEVWLWRQSNHLVHGEKIWDAAKKRDPDFTCAKHFWWYNMYSSADISATPRPMYPADGRKLPDIYTHPADLRPELQARFGQFPLFNFWGPTANIVSSKWIADSAAHVYRTRRPTLTLVYLPHLDYCLQKLGPSDPAIASHLREIDAVCGELIETARRDGTRVVVCSEYGITDVAGPIHINRKLREAGLIAVRDELGRELLDAGASEAFAVADHQIAHVYVRRPERIGEVRALLQDLPGVGHVLDEAGKRDFGLDHPRSGELVALSQADRWFTYYYWLDDDRAPDFARTVEIHRKPGYDPVEMFVDPEIRVPQVAIGMRLAKKAIGMRTLMDVIPLDATLVKGSHGRLTDRPEHGPIFITSEPQLVEGRDQLAATDFKNLILDHLFA